VKKGQATVPPPVFNALQLYVAKEIPVWQQAVINLLQSCYEAQHKCFTLDDATLAKRANALPNVPQEARKKLMPFLADVKKDALAQGHVAFTRTLAFDELAFLNEATQWLDRDAFAFLSILDASDAAVLEPGKAATALPGQPGLFFYHIEAS
jgi:hypothetical protein